MANLTKKEQELLQKLQAKAEAPEKPDRGPSSRVLNVSVDLSDPEQVKLAERYGLLEGLDDGGGDDDDDDDQGGDDDDQGGDEPPKRRGYFE